MLLERYSRGSPLVVHVLKIPTSFATCPASDKKAVGSILSIFGIIVEPGYDEVLGTMEITLLFQVSHIRVNKTKKYKELGPAKLPCYTLQVIRKASTNWAI